LPSEDVRYARRASTGDTLDRVVEFEKRGYGIQMAPALARLAAALIRDDPEAAPRLADGDPVAISPARGSE